MSDDELGLGFVDMRDGPRLSSPDGQVAALRQLQAAIRLGLEDLGHPDGPLADALRKVLFVDFPEDLWAGK